MRGQPLLQDASSNKVFYSRKITKMPPKRAKGLKKSTVAAAAAAAATVVGDAAPPAKRARLDTDAASDDQNEDSSDEQQEPVYIGEVDAEAADDTEDPVGAEVAELALLAAAGKARLAAGEEQAVAMLRGVVHECSRLLAVSDAAAAGDAPDGELSVDQRTAVLGLYSGGLAWLAIALASTAALQAAAPPAKKAKKAAKKGKKRAEPEPEEDEGADANEPTPEELLSVASEIASSLPKFAASHAAVPALIAVAKPAFIGAKGTVTVAPAAARASFVKSVSVRDREVFAVLATQLLDAAAAANTSTALVKARGAVAEAAWNDTDASADKQGERERALGYVRLAVGTVVVEEQGQLASDDKDIDRAQVEAAKAQLESAQADFAKAAALAKSDADIHKSLGDVSIQLGVIAELQDASEASVLATYKKALGHYAAAVKIDKDSVDAEHVAGIKQMVVEMEAETE
ncbi:hypothetical protein BC828DRAFT_207797 [Blastocladiella britannica]|nr:hypothetical protein BC828DRAFT_207797 [Blastocladiella britannica]